MSNSKQPLLVFIHIPRTGGTSFWKILNDYYGHENCYRITAIHEDNPDEYDAYNEAIQLLENDTYKYDVISGHMRHWGVTLNEHSPRPIQYITILRQPADQVLSRYYKIIGLESHRKHDSFLENGLDKDVNLGVEHFIEGGLNWQTRHIAGAEKLSDIDDQMLEKAKQTLEENFLMAAVLERFTESMHVLKHRANWSRFLRPTHTNKGKSRPNKIPAHIYDKINQNSEYDLELYRFGNELLDRHIREASPRIYIDMASDNVRTKLRTILRGDQS